MRHLGLSLLGGFEADLDGKPITAFGTDKVRGLLVYLAVEADHAHRREELASLFWAEKPERTARKSLRQGLTMLRGALDDRNAEVPFLLVTRQTVQWNPAANCTIDTVLFAQLVAQSLDGPLSGDDILELERAVGLYKGEFLTGFSLSGCLKFDEWVRQERESLHQQMLVALDRLTVYYSGQQEYVKTIEYAQRQIALERWREEAHRQLMSALANSGQRNQALAQYETCCDILAEELAVEPHPETSALYEQIRTTTRPRPMMGQPSAGLGEAVSASQLAATKRQGQVEQKMKLRAPVSAPTVPMYHFPVQFTSFIGRESELTQIIRQLRNPDCRFLTLIGPGGIGKTSLSIEVARWLSENMLGFFDGIYFVPLADVATSDLLLVSLANSLGLTWQESGEPKPQLLNYLRSKNSLLVLDNFEHLLSGGDLLLEILMAAPNVKMLVTSREPLNLRVEWRQHLDGLAYPSQPEQLTRSSYSAVQLFVQAAAQVQPGFCATPDKQAPIVRICQLLQGMPLGIELAAAWVRFYDCDTIAQKIADNLDFLVTPLRDMPERHRSMRAVFEHSWKLLSASEQRLLAQVSIFRGGFTFDAALAITNATLRHAGSLSASQAQGTARVDLMALLDKSLLRRMAEERIVVHELLRQFVAERFDETQDDQKVRDRHAAYYSAFLQEYAPALSQQQDALAQIGQEIENVRLAWQWAVQHAKFDYIEQSLDSLFSFYEIRSWFQEGEATFRKAVNHLQHSSPPLSDQLVWKLVARQGVFCHRLGHYEQAKALLQKSLDALSATGSVPSGRSMPGTNSGFGATSAPKRGGDEAERAFCLSNLASVSISLGQYHIAKPLLQEAIGLARQAQLAFSSSPRALAIEADSLRELGNICWHEGDYAPAETYYQKALSIYRAPSVADRRGEAWALNRLGFVAWSQGDYQQAQAYHERALQIFRPIGNQQGEATVLNHLGTVLEQQGYYSEANANYSQALRIFRQVGDLKREAIALSNLGFVCHHYGNYHEAKGYFEQMLYLTRQIGYRRGESLAKACLGLLFHQLADNQAALAYSQQALQITREIGNRTIEGYALTHLGHALTELGDLAEAAATYQEAITLRQELGKPNLAMEAVAGLARVYLALGDLPQALAQAEKILSHLEQDTLAGTLERFRVHLTCYRVLRTHDASQPAQTKTPRDPQKLLRRAAKELQMYAHKISDEQMRRSYLLNVVAHRDIMRQSLPSTNIHHAAERVNKKTGTTQSAAQFSNALAVA